MHDEMDCDVEMQLLDSPEADETTERDTRREHERSEAGPSQAALWLKSHDRTWPLRSVRVLDIGPGGLSFEAEGPLPVGTTLEMNINTPVKNAISAVAEVCYAIEWAGSYRVGVKFIRMSDSDRRLLDGRTFRDASAPRVRRRCRRRGAENWWEWQDTPY